MCGHFTPKSRARARGTAQGLRGLADLGVRGLGLGVIGFRGVRVSGFSGLGFKGLRV